MISKEEFLNGNWWLVIARYPVACDASINEVIESEEDPTLELSYANELRDECVNSFSYLDSPDIELEAIKIDEKVIDEYGIEWLNDYLA